MKTFRRIWIIGSGFVIYSICLKESSRHAEEFQAASSSRLEMRAHDTALFLSISRNASWFRPKAFLSCRARETRAPTWPLISPRNIVPRWRGGWRNSRAIHHTHRNSWPTTVHPLRRLLSLRRNVSATLSLSIVRRVIPRIHPSNTHDGRVTRKDTRGHGKSDTSRSI